jgi:MFS transporter, DHA1 family, tetracycline resistance protein
MAAVTLLAFSEMLADPLIQAMVSELAPHEARATYMAALSAVNDLRDTAGPATGIWLYARAVPLPWLVGAPIAMAATLALALTVRRRETAAKNIDLNGDLLTARRKRETARQASGSTRKTYEID